MNALTVKLAPLQEIEIAREIDRLFMLQDRPLSADKKDMIVAELSATGMPFRALVSGIRDLCDQDVKQLKLHVIKDAARKYFTYKDNSDECSICGRSGFVTMTNKEGYEVACPCICARGSSVAQVQGIPAWNGQRTMFSKKYGEMALTHPDPDNVVLPEGAGAAQEPVMAGSQTGRGTWEE